MRSPATRSCTATSGSRRAGATPPSSSAVDLRVELADALRERGEELVRELRHLVEQTGELARPEHEHGAVGLGDRGGRARPLVEQRQLAEVGARPERRDLASVALDLDLALDEHEALPPDLVLLHEGAPFRDLDLVGGAGDALQILLRARREERHRCQVLEVLVPARHSRSSRSMGPSGPRTAQSVGGLDLTMPKSWER